MNQAHAKGIIFEKRTAKCLGQQLRWGSILTWNNEDFGSVGLRGHAIENDLLLPQLRNGVVAV